MIPGMKMTVDRVKQVLQGIRDVPTRDVLVGIPADSGDGERGEQQGSNLRSDQLTDAKGKNVTVISDIKNADLGFIHENGAPEVGIPPRPFLIPGVRQGSKGYTEYLKQAAVATLEGNPGKADRAMHAAGMSAMSSVQSKLKSGPFIPLKPATIARRRVRSAGSSYRRKATTAADVRPLIDTAQMLRAVTYVVRTKAR